MRMQSLAAFVLAMLLGAPVAARAQMSDATVAEAAATAVRGCPSFTIFDDISIAVDNRAVTLRGYVTMPYKRDDIVKRVSKLDGVRSVDDQIVVLPVDPADDGLRRRIAAAIYGNPAFWQYAALATPPIHIIVNHRRVTLTGVLPSEVDRMLAYSLAQVDGVMGVTNSIRVEGGL
jgi:hyperosmotically inducible protein